MTDELKQIHIDFHTIREEFSEYEAENGQILKLKKILTDILREKDENDKERSGLKFQDFSNVINTKKIDTTGMEKANLIDVTEKDEIKSLNFLPKREIVNIYETEKNFIIASNKVTHIFSTNKIDDTGFPYIRFRTKFGISIITKESILEPIDKTGTEKSTKN